MAASRCYARGMGVFPLRRLFAALAAVWLLAAGGPAWAAGFAPGSTCHLFLQPGESREAALQSPARWNCSQTGSRLQSERALLRFDLRGRAEPPAYFVTRASGFERLTLSASDADGRLRALTFRPDTMPTGTGVYQMYAPLPELPRGAEAVIADIEQPLFSGAITDARLTAQAPLGQAGALETLIAILCGLLIAPILFDLAFFRVLRERFLLWHALTGTMMLIYSAVTGGVVARFVPLTVEQGQAIVASSFSAAIASAAMFFRDYAEPGILERRHRMVIYCLVAASMGLAVFNHWAPLPAPVMQTAYYLGWSPVIAGFVWLMVEGLRRGSRATKFQVAAWTPQILVSLYRIGGNIGLTATAIVAFLPFYTAVTLEVLITALGVADRFMIIKRERDRARIEARMLGEIAELDALTGLYNRHGIEPRYEALYASGFTSMALLDLDLFKAINDTHGHAAGDAVLKAAAEALAPDEDTVALRLGGEEFLLLLRGHGVAQRAEARRRAITARIAELVPGLDRPVTASMGMVERDASQRLQASFQASYEHCDRLLYEAKSAGRNQTMRERVRSFPPERRRAPVAA